MALQTSGAISLANVQTEFGGSNPISMSEYYAGGSYVPSGTGSVATSSTITISSFYGTSNKAPAGSQTFTSSGTFTVPIGYTSVTICMVGGGGGGGTDGRDNNAGGGYAGGIVTQTVAVTPGGSITVTIGTGGLGSLGINKVGAAGTVTSFGAVTANGGAGGSGVYASSYNYKGNGASRVTCNGIAYDGNSSIISFYSGSATYYGGQAGFGNGGSSRGGHGGVGAGGGAANNTRAGSGGRGECIVSWS